MSIDSIYTGMNWIHFSPSSFHLHSSVKIYVKWLPFTSITIHVRACEENVYLCSWLLWVTNKKMWQFSLLFNFTVMETSRSLMCDFGWIRVCVRLYINGSVRTRTSVCACVRVSEFGTLNCRLNVGAATANRLTRDLINTIEIFDYLFKSPSPNCMCVYVRCTMYGT